MLERGPQLVQGVSILFSILKHVTPRSSMSWHRGDWNLTLDLREARSSARPRARTWVKNRDNEFGFRGSRSSVDPHAQAWSHEWLTRFSLKPNHARALSPFHSHPHSYFFHSLPYSHFLLSLTLISHHPAITHFTITLIPRLQTLTRDLKGGSLEPNCFKFTRGFAWYNTLKGLLCIFAPWFLP